MKTEHKYIPALRFHWLTPLYDPLLRWLMQEERFKQTLIQEANIQSGQQVLDLGCGTATLTIMIKKACPQTIVTGLDADPQVLKAAQIKAEKAGVNLTLEHGMAYRLPYAAASFDRVVSSLMFHHLTTLEKQQTFEEVCRVLKPDGALYIIDFGPPVGIWSHLISPLMARLEEVGDHHKGLIPKMMREIGFNDVTVTSRFATVFGTLYMYEGWKS